MIITLRGGESFWRAVRENAEHALAGEYSVIAPGGESSEPEVEIRFLPVDVQENFAILVLPDPDASASLDPWLEFEEREEGLARES